MVNTTTNYTLITGVYRFEICEGLAAEGYSKKLIGEVRIRAEGKNLTWFAVFTPAGSRIYTQNLTEAIREFNNL